MYRYIFRSCAVWPGQTQYIMIRVLCEDAAMIGTQLYTLHVTSLLFVFLLVLTYNMSMYYLYSSILLYRARVILNLHTAKFRK